MKEISPELLEEIRRRIVDSIHPEKIVLFGSHAWGQPTEESDIDLLIVLNRSDLPGYRAARQVYHCLRGIKAPIEVTVCTRDQAARSMSVKTSLIRKALDAGILLYG